jgi:hypothetical protein
MHRRHLVLALAVAGAMLTGCSTLRSDLLVKDKPLTSDKDGLIVASFGYTVSVDRLVRVQQEPTIRLVVTPHPDREGKKIQLTTADQIFTNGAWNEEEIVRRAGTSGRVLVGYRVPAGSYQLLQREVKLHGPRNWEAQLPLAAPWRFTVVPGQITYIGAHVLHTQFGESLLFRVLIPARARLVILDESNEDIDALRRVRPELRDVTFNNALRTDWPLE